MNRDSFTPLLAMVLVASVTAAAGLCYWYLHKVREHKAAQEEVARINRHRALLQAMAAESVEYSKRNPAILPILQGLGIAGRATTNAASGGGVK